MSGGKRSTKKIMDGMLSDYVRRPVTISGELKRMLSGQTKLQLFPMLAFALVAIPSAALALFVAKFGVNVIINDEWDMVPVYQKMVNGNLSFADLFAQHNEHRIFFPRIAMLTLDRLTSFDTVAEMYLSWIIITVTAAVIFYLFWKANGRARDLKVIAYFVPISLLIFSFRQEEAILWGFTCQIYLTIISVITALLFLDKGRSRSLYIPLSIASGIVASYSFLPGLVIWPAGLLKIALGIDNKARRIKALIVWCLSGIVVTGLYLYDFHFTSDVQTSHSFLRSAEYFFAVLGAPFTFELAYFAASIGAIVAAIALLVIFQAWKAHIIRENSVWISMIFFAVVSAIATTIGRSGFGVAQALSSRYTPITVLGVVGLYSFALSASKHYNGMGRRFCVHALLTLILLGLIVSTGAGWHIGQQTRIERQMAIHVLETYQRQPDAEIAKYLNPNSTLVREWAGYLRVNRLNVFAGDNLTETSLLQTANLLSPEESGIVYELMRMLVQVGSIFHSLPLFTFHLLNVYL